ncbi:MAG: IPT/TIG domain-containing protein, partial [Legionella sp.]|uniref:beta strand repeat-containing protein n=1 Tax=Legionella sp. TaxID=459 RepID=UPI002846734F|nr:IPT/TIG domain-containing protein [Legionella sp.]
TISGTGSLTAVVPAYVSGPLAADVTVTNAEGSTTLAGGFTYTAATPTLATITPSSGTTSGGTTITLTGTGFVPGTTVLLDGIDAVNVQVLNNTTLTAVTPAHASGAVNVEVNNGAGVATLTGAFTYVGGGLSLSGITPFTGSVAGGTVITLSGTNLSGTTSVTVGGVPATGVTVVDANTVTAIVPAYVSGPLASDVTVSNGSTNATLVGGFTYQAIAPSIISISPNTSTVAGGITATVTGSNFVPGTLVMIGGVTASNITVVNASTITLLIPAYVSGSLVKDVAVNNGVAAATLAAAFTYTPVGPTATGVVPSVGPLAGGTFITVSGSGFTPNTTVSVGGIPATNITVNNSHVLTAVTPAYVSGPLTVDVVVSNSVSNATLSGAFTYQGVTPTLESITPNSGSAAGGTTVTVIGSGFVPGTTLSIGGVAATNINITNVSTLTATIPAYVSGSLVKDVTLNNGIGSATLPGGYTYIANAPTLTGITPNTGSVIGGTVVTLTGTGFTLNSTVSFGGLPATSVTFSSPTSMTATVPAYISGSLAVDVVVNNGASNATLSGGFTYLATTPVISSVSPNTGSVQGGTLLIISGSGFVPGTTVTLGGVDATSVIVLNSTTLTAVTPAYVSGSLIKDVTVNNSAGNFTLHSGFTYIGVAPVLSTISPISGSVTGGTTVTITGTGFIPGMTVSFGGVAATDVEAVNATTLTAVTPSHAAGVVDVVVNNGVSSATSVGAYTYIANAPVLTAISPATGGVNGGITVTLTGTGLTGMTAVTFGGVSATDVVVTNDTTITAVVPAYVSGPLVVDVIVSNGSTNATLVGGFTYLSAAPTISAISPNSSSITGGITATISGSGFVPGTTVTIGGVTASAITIVNSTTLTLTVPAYVSGSLVADVVVNNGTGSATLTGGFTYVVGAPTLSGISPSTGSSAGGTLVTITGTGFTPGTTVTFGGVAATNVNVGSANTLTAVTPAYVNGAFTVDVVVNNGVSNATLSHAFTYQATAPTLTSVTPNTDSVTGGATITVNGSGFGAGTSLAIGGITATNIQITNSTTLTATVPAYVSGSLIKDVVVNNGAGIATLTAGFTYIESVPGLSGLTPGTGSILGGTTVTLTGSGFAPGTTVTFGGVSATAVTVVNS